MFTAPGGFQAAPVTGAVTSTACGLLFWSAFTNIQPVVVRGRTYATVTGLTSNAAYEVNVVAVCDYACWKANGMAPLAFPGAASTNPNSAPTPVSDDAAASAASASHLPVRGEGARREEGTATMSTESGSGSGTALGAAEEEGAGEEASAAALLSSFLRVVGGGSASVSSAAAAAAASSVLSHSLSNIGGTPALGATPVSAQSVVYSSTPFVAGASGSITASSFPIAGIVGILLSVVVLAGGTFAYIRYARYAAGGRENQYASMDVSAAMNTISVPAPGSSPSSSSAGAAAISSSSSAGGRGSGGGFMAGLRSFLSAPRTGGGVYGRTALADSDYSEMEDRAAAYM